MSTRTIQIEVPHHWTKDEVTERLERLRAPSETEAQRSKSASRVELESRALASTIQRVEQLMQRVALLEQTRSDLATVEALGEIEGRADLLKDRLDDLDQQIQDAQSSVGLASKAATEEVEGLRGEIKKQMRSVRGSIAHLKRHVAERLTNDE